MWTGQSRFDDLKWMLTWWTNDVRSAEAWNNLTLQVITIKDMDKDNLLAHGEKKKDFHQSQ
jgi:hypothetical protein